MPKVYRRPPSNTWYLRSWPYRIFMLRELSAVFAAIYFALFLLLVTAVRNGEGSFEDYLDVLKNPALVIFHAVALAFAMLHTVTWFQAVPKAMPLKFGENKVPDIAMIGGVYVVWAIASIVVAIVFLV